nr:hypothetical protein RSP597_25350 [Ralstonia solanacearum]
MSGLERVLTQKACVYIFVNELVEVFPHCGGQHEIVEAPPGGHVKNQLGNALRQQLRAGRRHALGG